MIRLEPQFLVRQPSVRQKLAILGPLRHWALWRHGRPIHQSGGHWGRTSSGGLKVGAVSTFKMSNVGTVPTFKMHNVGTVPTYKTHNVGTVPTYNLMEDHLWWKTDLWRRTTFGGRRALTEDNLWRKMTVYRVYSILPEKNVYDSSPWQPQQNWSQTGNTISCLNRK